jgi:hypothetical protein
VRQQTLAKQIKKGRGKNEKARKRVIVMHDRISKRGKAEEKNY